METMGYRNLDKVDELARAGRFQSVRGDAHTFDPMQYALLSRMARATYDWPLDKEAKKSDGVPRTYDRGWLAMAYELGMICESDGIAAGEQEIIGNLPRYPRLERLAMQRLSLTAKKLEEAGLIKCLFHGSAQKKNNSIWLLMIGDDEENAEVEQYVRDHRHL